MSGEMETKAEPGSDAVVNVHTTCWKTFPLTCPADKAGLITLMIAGSLVHYLPNPPKFGLVVHSFLPSADVRKTAEEINDLYHGTGSRSVCLTAMANEQAGHISAVVLDDLTDKLKFLQSFAERMDEGFGVHLGAGHRIRVAGHKGAISNMFRIVVAEDGDFHLEVAQGIPRWVALEKVAKEQTSTEVKQHTEELSKTLYSQLASVTFFGDSLDHVDIARMTVWISSWPNQLKDILQSCEDAIKEKEMSLTQQTEHRRVYGHWIGSYCLDTLTDSTSDWGPGPKSNQPIPTWDLSELPAAVNAAESNIEEARYIRKLLAMINSVAVFSSNQAEQVKQMGLAEHLEKLTARTIDVLVEWVNYFVPMALRSWPNFQNSLDAMYVACSDMLSEVHRVAFVESSMRVVIGHYLIALAAQKSPELITRAQEDLNALAKLPAVVYLCQSENNDKKSSVTVEAQCTRAVESFNNFMADNQATDALHHLLEFIHGVAPPNSPVLGQLIALRKQHANKNKALVGFQIRESSPRWLWSFSCKVISFTPAAPAVLAQNGTYFCHLSATTTSSQSEAKKTAAVAPVNSQLVWGTEMEFKGDFQSAEVKLEERGVVSGRVVASASLEKAKVRYQAVLSACLTNSAHYSGAYFPLTLELKTKDGVAIGTLGLEVRLSEVIGLREAEKKKSFLSLGRKFTTTKSVEPSWRFNRDLPASKLTDFMFPLSDIVERWHLAAAKYLQDDIVKEDREKVNGTMAALTALKDLYMMQDPSWMLARKRVWVGLIKATQDCGNSSVSMGFAVLYFQLNPKSKWVGFINGGTGGVKMQMYGFKNGRVFTILEGKPGAAKFSQLAMCNYRPESYGMPAYDPAGKLPALEAMKGKLKETLDDAPWKNHRVLAHLGLPASSSHGKPTVPIFAFLTGVIREHWERQPAHTQAAMEQDVAAIFAYADASVQPATLLLPGEGKKSFFIPQKQEGQRELVAVRAMYAAVKEQRVELKNVEVVSSLGIGTGSSQWCSIDPHGNNSNNPESYLTTSIHCGMRDWNLVQQLGSGVISDLQSEQGKLKAYANKLLAYGRPMIALKSGAALGMWSSVFPKLRKELCAPASAHEGLTFAEVCANMTFGQNSIHQYLGMHIRGGFAEFRTTEKPPAWLLQIASKDKWGPVNANMLDSIEPAMNFCYEQAIKQPWVEGWHYGINILLRGFTGMCKDEADSAVLIQLFVKFDAALYNYVSWLEQFREESDVKRCLIANTCADGHSKIPDCRKMVLDRMKKKGTDNNEESSNVAEEKEFKEGELPNEAMTAFSGLLTQCAKSLATNVIEGVLAVFRGGHTRALQELVNCCVKNLAPVPQKTFLGELKHKLSELEPTAREMRLSPQFSEDVEDVKRVVKPLFVGRHAQRDWEDAFRPLEQLGRVLEGTSVEENPATSSTSFM